MKNIVSMICLVLLMASCQSKDSGTKENSGSAVISPENAITMHFKVTGMTCTNCENTINESVKSLPGVATSISSFTDSTTKVTFDKTLSKPEEIKAAIEKKGYIVTSWSVLE